MYGSLQFSSRWYLCARKKPICAPSRLSEISPTSPLKRFQCSKVLFSTRELSSASTLFLVELLHMSCFISTLLLALFARPGILGYSVFLGWAGGSWGKDPFNTSDLCSGTLLLSLSGVRLHSLLLYHTWKPTSSLLHLSFSFFSFHKPVTSSLMIVYVTEASDRRLLAHTCAYLFRRDNKNVYFCQVN